MDRARALFLDHDTTRKTSDYQILKALPNRGRRFPLAEPTAVKPDADLRPMRNRPGQFQLPKQHKFVLAAGPGTASQVAGGSG